MGFGLFTCWFVLFVGVILVAFGFAVLVWFAGLGLVCCLFFFDFCELVVGTSVCRCLMFWVCISFTLLFVFGVFFGLLCLEFVVFVVLVFCCFICVCG